MKKILNEFKDFISRGNVMDMAVGVIIGGAFTAIVNSLVSDLLNPLLSLITGGLDFSGMKLPLSDAPDAATFNYGAFITAVINFLLVAIAIFFLVKLINEIHNLGTKKAEDAPAAPTTKVCPFCKTEIALDATRCPHCTSQLEE